MTPIRFTTALILCALAPLASAAPPAGSGANPTIPAPMQTDPGAEPAAVPQGPPAAEPQPALAPALEGLTWQLAAYRLGDALVEPKEGQSPARFKLEQGRLSGSAGCNRLMGSYTLKGESIVFEPKMASTMMACPELLMAQDQAVGQAFAAVVRVRLAGDLMELLDAEGKPVLRFLRPKQSPLVGPIWQLQGYHNGKQAIVSPLAGTQVTLELRDDGTLGGSDGCNRFMSGYTLDGEKLAIGPLATTRMACRGPEGAAAQASEIAAALGTVAGYRVEGGELTLLDGKGKPAARFRAAY